MHLVLKPHSLQQFCHRQTDTQTFFWNNQIVFRTSQKINPSKTGSRKFSRNQYFLFLIWKKVKIINHRNFVNILWFFVHCDFKFSFKQESQYFNKVKTLNALLKILTYIMIVVKMLISKILSIWKNLIKISTFMVYKLMCLKLKIWNHTNVV